MLFIKNLNYFIKNILTQEHTIKNFTCRKIINNSYVKCLAFSFEVIKNNLKNKNLQIKF